MSAIMDMYFNSSESNMSLQEMLDLDIKSEIDILIGGHNDLSGLNFSELPPLELEDVSDVRWFSQNSNFSNSSFTLDIKGDGATAMVNPNTVMPLSLAQNIRSPSPTLKESHLTFSPSTIKFTPTKSGAGQIQVKKDLLKKMDSYQFKNTEKIVEKKGPILKSVNKGTMYLPKSIVKTVTKPPTELSFRNTINRQISSPVTVTNFGTVRTISNNHGRKQQFNNNRLYDEDFKPFPKPAYSYSCLIAMALRNSRSGSLPVSEIYNFMCKHFPYFKTAPNGWKNSVRHNLSLNKCFEKIEKPVVNGAHRKGCLWAMNPNKINKMDEEVQKWSKKDPSAIRKAMVNPENLEALRRGELKFSCSYDEDNFADSCGSAESEGSDSETEENNVNISTQYINVGNIKSEEDEDEGEEFDVEVAETMCEDDLDNESEHKFLRMEIARAHKELGYDRAISNKRRKTTYIIQN